MEYDAIILELLSRIKKLEADVAELKLAIGGAPLAQSPDDEDLAQETESDTPSPRKRLTEEMIDNCYKGGKMAFAGENVQTLAADIAEAAQMNESSATIYLYAVKCMLGGQVYKRAISAKAIKKYFDNILSEYGSAGLKKAIHATRLHVEYRRSCGHNVDSIEELCNEYAGRL